LWKDGVIVTANGKDEKVGPADTIVMALGSRSVNTLAPKLEGKVEKLITIGDAVKVRKALEAIEEGYRAGLEIINHIGIG